MTKLIEQIRNEAVTSTVPLGDLLRRVTILASRLGDNELEEWVSLELNGYRITDPIPEYRRLRGLQLVGSFIEFDGQVMQNVPVALSAVPDDLRYLIEKVELRWPLSSLEKLLVDHPQNGTFALPLPADLAPLIKHFENASCLKLELQVPAMNLRSMVDAVRNRVLRYALEIEKNNPEAGEAVAPPVPAATLHQAFTSNITGPVGNVAIGSSNVTQRADVNVRGGDFKSLAAALRGHGVADADLSALKDAIDSEPIAEVRAKKSLGSRVTEWLGRQAMKTAAEIPVTFSVELVARLVMAYYGISAG